ncbi:GntR family transcriptional regulator [Thalassotalea crassostreae]|uniref:GntR family transcriptional regulator n=1 Tax=Thalassotalea crassostreae TaxID=1763536 RepID=UPI00083844F6|nr:GntR family transcriptional regulator [Thalassotalea crassostreae]
MQQTTLRQQAYERMRDMFLSGSITAGSPLSENTLAKKLGMSRTPIREAIRQMEMEGLVDYAPRFGAVLHTPSCQELTQMYGVREALESYAAVEAAQSITPKTLRQLELLWLSMQDITEEFELSENPIIEGDSLDTFLNADIEFHQLIVAAAENEYLSKMVNETRLLVRVFTSTHWCYDLYKLEQANQFHRRLLDALINRDSEAARLATIEAMQVAKANALEALTASIK